MGARDIAELITGKPQPRKLSGIICGRTIACERRTKVVTRALACNRGASDKIRLGATKPLEAVYQIPSLAWDLH